MQGILFLCLRNLSVKIFFGAPGYYDEIKQMEQEEFSKFEPVWQRLIDNQGNEFYGKKKTVVTYRIEGDNFIVISNGQETVIAKSLLQVIYDSPAASGVKYRESGFPVPHELFGILHDKRILDEWRVY